VTELATLTWPDTAARAAGTLVAIPVGSTEQHGPHLPLSTDTDLAVALAQRLVWRRADVVVAPAVSYGSSGEHAAFPGTLSIGQTALEQLLVELIRSADAFAGTVLVSTHGGNLRPVERAVERLNGEGRRVRAWRPPPGDPADAHAGHTETSLLLALHPGRVHLDRAEAGTRQPLHELWPALRQAGVAAVSANGVLGDPTGASATAGERLLAAWTEDLWRSIEGWP
jgi:mycofactocin system creatininase family protein